MSSYLSLTQLETLYVQRVTDVVTEFARTQARSRTRHSSIALSTTLWELTHQFCRPIVFQQIQIFYEHFVLITEHHF